MVEAFRRPFAQVGATPYAWPFDGRWFAGDTALLLLGFQQGTIQALSAGPALAAAVALAATARQEGIVVMATRRGSPRSASSVADRRKSMGDVVPAAGSSQWQLAPELGAFGDEGRFDHGGDNAFFGTDLEHELKARGIRNLLIAGLPTDGLVHASQRAANDIGFECLAVSDACWGTDLARHQAQLRITTFGNGLFGAVADSTQVREALLGT